MNVDIQPVAVACDYHFASRLRRNLHDKGGVDIEIVRAKPCLTASGSLSGTERQTVSVHQGPYQEPAGEGGHNIDRDDVGTCEVIRSMDQLSEWTVLQTRAVQEYLWNRFHLNGFLVYDSDLLYLSNSNRRLIGVLLRLLSNEPAQDNLKPKCIVVTSQDVALSDVALSGIVKIARDQGYPSTDIVLVDESFIPSYH